MARQKIITNFNKYIQSHFFEVKTNVNKLILTEDKGTKYNVQLNVSRPHNSFLIIHNLEELKQNHASYLKQYPKDCDYIIIDLHKSNILLIELKDTRSDTNTGIMRQLNAGQKWLEHLLFCSKSDYILSDYPTYKIAIKYTPSRPSTTRRVNKSSDRGDLYRSKDVIGEELITFKGNIINIDAFVN